MLDNCIDIFFIKQKSSYEMRISDWSSDVCSSDLQVLGEVQPGIGKEAGTRHLVGIHHRAPALGVGDDAAEIPHRRPEAFKVGDRPVIEIVIVLEVESALLPQPLQEGGELCIGDAGLGGAEEHTSELRSLMRL